MYNKAETIKNTYNVNTDNFLNTLFIVTNKINYISTLSVKQVSFCF